ncbi:MAG: phycobilisome linker polypeptide [Iphinoe sp. HA4291-MV1]|jgi:predicted dinucleotide-binding enzyme|nr:phycobilisome linker polypeptide [Iphinoe sp. HA4291-MV1]
MVYQIVSGRSNNSIAANRSFRFEVIGLHQNEVTDKNDYAIRSSASVFITVPFSRLNEELQRINRLGGKIVSIQPLALETYEA